MNRCAEQPLDAYRLAAYVTPCPCFLCGGGNNFDAEFCRHCQAPMSLTQQAALEKSPPRLAACLGAASAGKTVYLGMLSDILSRSTGELQMLARGALSISLQQNTLAALARCAFPEKTPCDPDRWSWLHCQIRSARRRRPVDLILPDVSGEALLEEAERRQAYPVIRSLLAKCSATLVLLDAAALHAGDPAPDYFAMKMVSFLLELDGHKKTGWPHRPVGLVFTKADQCDEAFEDPEGFARQHAAGTYRMCRDRLTRHRFFAASVAGACVNVQRRGGGWTRVPLRIEPRGVVEPFAWLVEELAR